MYPDPRVKTHLIGSSIQITLDDKEVCRFDCINPDEAASRLCAVRASLYHDNFWKKDGVLVKYGNKQFVGRCDADDGHTVVGQRITLQTEGIMEHPMTLHHARFFQNRFENVTGQKLAEWSAHEQLTADGQQENPELLATCVSECARAEIIRLLEESTAFDAVVVRNLASIIADIDFWLGKI